MQRFKRVVPRHVRLIFKSGHVETVTIPDDVEVTWKLDFTGTITDLDIPQVQGSQGGYIDVGELAALFVIKREER